MEEFGFEKLDVWRKSMEVVDQIYAITKTFPQVELFGLSSQMRRAAVSMPSNIAEGHGRGSKAFGNFLLHARGSAYELRTQLEIARRQGYIEDEAASEVKRCLIEVSKMLDGLHRSLP